MNCRAIETSGVSLKREIFWSFTLGPLLFGWEVLALTNPSERRPKNKKTPKNEGSNPSHFSVFTALARVAITV